MAHRPHGLLLRSLRNSSGTYFVIAGVLMAVLAAVGEPHGLLPLQQGTLQDAVDFHALGAADDVWDRAREQRAIVCAQHVADAGDDIVGSVRRKRGRKASLAYRAKAAVAKKVATAKQANLLAMFRQDARDQKAGKHALEGVASFYSFDTQTASGERFNARAMVAAHRTLPFGTWIRVTDLDTAQSVTVRVNDRGPYVDGRIVDLTTAAAETLGITRRGLAKVKLDVVEGPAKPVQVAQNSEPAACVDENPAKPRSLMLVMGRLSSQANATP